MAETIKMPASTFLPLANEPPKAIKGHRLYDYLQADNRPTFLVSVSALNNFGQFAGTSYAFYNTSLSTDNVLLENITHVLAGLPSDKNHHQSEATAFYSWILGDARSPVWFCETLWSATDIDSDWRVVSGIHLPKKMSFTKTTLERGGVVLNESEANEAYHSEILLSSVAEPSAHERHVQTFDWASTELGPIASWPHALYQAVKQALACPTPYFIYWSPSRNIIWNDAGIENLRGIDGVTLGASAFHIFSHFWNDIFEPLCRGIEQTGRAIAPVKSPGPLMDRDGGLRETFWTYDYMPMLNDQGEVAGISGLIHDATTEVLVEGRIDTLLKVNEAMTTAVDLASFWQVIFTELERNAADVPLAAVYTIGSEEMIDCFADLGIWQEWQNGSNSNYQELLRSARGWSLEGKIGFPDGHPYVPSKMAFSGTDLLSVAFRQAMSTTEIQDLLLCTENGTLPPDSLSGCDDRGLGFECTQLIACPLQRPSGGVIAWLVLGINPRRAYDDEYKRFTRLLSRHVESKLVLILTVERDRLIARKSAEEAALQQQQLSLRLQQQKRELDQIYARLFKFMEQAPIGVYVIDGEGQVKFHNDAWLEITGVRPGNEVMQALHERTHPEDAEKIDREWVRLAAGSPTDRFEWRVLRPGSTSFDTEDDVRYLESYCFPEMGDDGAMNTITGLVTDVTIHKAYQREQTQKLKNALEAKRAQEYFMDMVSHEMRNPLNSIIQCTQEISESVEILRDEKHAKDETRARLDDVKDMIDTILYCGVHQKQLIDDVLTLSKLDARLLVVYPAETDPAALVNQAIKVFNSEIRLSKIETLISVHDFVSSDKRASTIMIDPSRITQILINLISNAVKFMKGRVVRKIQVSVHTARERQAVNAQYIASGHAQVDPTEGAEWGAGEPIYLYFSVRDTGPGLSDSEMKSLFTRFRQASPRTHVDYGGSRLGLFISRELTELHGGEIGILSQVGQGSTFVFYVKGRRCISHSEAVKADLPALPVFQQGSKMLSSDRTIPTKAPSIGSTFPQQDKILSALHVLVVEDNDINRKVLKRQLQKLGAEVTTAIHGSEALSILRTSTWWQGDQKTDSTANQRSNGVNPRFSIILCDLEMPVMDGATCVRQIRQWQRERLLHANIPVMAVTGNARAEKTLLGDGSGFNDVISKPYTLTSLVDQMLAHVDKSVVSAP